MYPVMNRGDHQEPIFRGARDRELLLNTMTQAWIAERLHMGTRTHLAHLLYWRNRKGLN